MQTVVDTQIYSSFAEKIFTSRAKRLYTENDTDLKNSNIFQHLISVNFYNKYKFRADSSLLIVADNDVVRFTVIATIFYWLKNFVVFDKTAKEIRFSVISVEQINDFTLSSLRYLCVCVDKIMRFFSFKVSSVFRKIMQNNITIDSIHVSRDITIDTSFYALHYDSDIYFDIFVYNFDRWLQQSQNCRMQTTFYLFLKDSRIYSEQTMAYFEIQFVLFYLIYRYNIRAADKKITNNDYKNISKDRKRKDKYQFYKWIIEFADNPLIEFIKRVF